MEPARNKAREDQVRNVAREIDSLDIGEYASAHTNFEDKGYRDSFISSLKPGRDPVGSSKEEAERLSKLYPEAELPDSGATPVVDSASNEVTATAASRTPHVSGDEIEPDVVANGNPYSIHEYFGKAWDKRIVSVLPIHCQESLLTTSSERVSKHGGHEDAGQYDRHASRLSAEGSSSDACSL